MTRGRSLQSFLARLRGKAEQVTLPRRQSGPVRLPDNRRLRSFAFVLEALEDRVVPSVGNLDLGFGSTGKVVTTVGIGTSRANAVVVQSDQRILVTGVASNGTDTDFALLRYNVDGSLDTTFGNGGLVLTDFAHGDDEALALALQADGRIVAAGSASTGGSLDFALVRFQPDGSLDTSFGSGGKATFAFSATSTEVALALALQADGKLVVVGRADGVDQDMAVVRFDPNGSPDPNFGAGGGTLIDFGSDADIAAAVALQADGRILVAGTTTRAHGSASNGDFAVARLTATGALDSDFATGGKSTTDFGFGDDAATSIVVQPTGNIVLAGRMTDGRFDFVALARYTPQGTLDTAFGVGTTTLGPRGTITTSIGVSSDAAQALVLQPNGKLVVAGRALLDPAGIVQQDFALARYTADGAVDQTFGINGQVTTGLGTGADVANALAATADGKLVAAGSAASATGTSFALARYQADIRPIAVDDVDRSASGFFDRIRVPVLGNDFDPDGDPTVVNRVITAGGRAISPGPAQQTPEGEFGTDGSVVTFKPNPGFVGAYSFTYTVFDGWLTSAPATITITVVSSDIKKAGDLVPEFGLTGRQLLVSDFGDDVATALAFQADGKLLMAGSFFDFDADFEVVRLNVDGTLDGTYGFSGFADRNFRFGDDIAYGLVVQPDGKAVAAGSALNRNGNLDFGLVRFTASGNPDSTFGSAGRVSTDFGGPDDEARGIVLQPDGKLVVVGFTGTGPSQDMALARYNSNGTLDTTFGTGGLVTFDSGLGADAANAVYLQADGKIVVAGSIANGQNQDFVLIRFLSNGLVDTTFGQGGLATLDFGRGDDVATALVVQPDGKLVLAGYAGNGQNEDFALARFTRAGLLDTSFGGGGTSFGPAGTITTNLGPGNDRATTVAILETGKMAAAGFSEQDNNSTVGRNRDFALVRYDALGRLDTGFGVGGKVLADQAADRDEIGALIVQPDGRMIVTGSVNAAGNLDKIVERFNVDGTLDTTYLASRATGRIFASFGRGNDFANGVAVQTNGAVVAVGSAANDDFFAVLRREGDRGIRDSTFGSDGRVITDLGPGKDIANAVALQPDGKILAVGNSEQDNGSSLGRNQDFALVRYNSDGSLDTTFGTGGKVTTDFLGWQDSARAVVLLPNGKILVAGSTGRNGTNDQFDFALARYNADGSLDPTFGQAGRVFTDFGQGNDFATGLAVLPDGRIVVGGSASNGSNQDFALARYTASGTLDTTFGNAGRVMTDFGFGDDEAKGLAVQADGRIVLVGRALTNRNFDVALARYNSDGSLDTSFRDPDAGRTGTITPDGTVATDFNADADTGNAVVIQADGRIVVVGSSTNQQGRDFALARYLTDGQLDTTFGNAGKMSANVDDDSGNAVALAPDGQIVLAGSSTTVAFGKSGFVLARFFDRALNDFPPVALADHAVTSQDVSVVIPVLANDTDQDNDALSVLRFTQGGAGRVQLNNDGTLTYTPEPGFRGTDHFTYTATDGNLNVESTVDVQVSANLPQLGAVIGGGSNLVVAERFLAISSASAVGISQGEVGPTSFLQPGTPFARLTSGAVRVAFDNRDAGVNNRTRLRGAFDVTILDLTLQIPQGVNYLSFEFSFYTNEYPLFRNRGFNDAFLAELDRTTWTVDPVTGTISAPNNFAFDPRDSRRQAVSASSAYFDDRRVVTLTGTLYNGSTPLLQAGTPITPGLHHLYLSLFDVGDGQIDSAVFIRNLVARGLPLGEAAPGVHQPPIAVDDFVPFRPNQPITLRVLDNDLSFDGAPFTLVRVSQGDQGQVVVDDATGTVTYTPAGAAADGTDSFTYTIQDAQGNTSTSTVRLVPLVTTSVSLSAGPTDAPVTTITTGITATANNNTPGSAPTAVTVAQYAGNPGLTTSAGSISLLGASFFDLQILGSDSSDRVVASFAAPADGSQLLYWTGTAFEPVRSSGNTDPVRTADGRFVVTLDGTSRPRITGLTGTVFTVSIPVSNPTPVVPITPPVVVGPTPTPTPTDSGGSDTGLGLSRNTSFRSSAALSLALAPSQDSSNAGRASQTTAGNAVSPTTTGGAAPGNSGTTSGQSSGAAEDEGQPLEEATFWRALLGDDLYWLWLMGGDEVLWMWLQKAPTTPMPLEAESPATPAASPVRPAPPAPDEQSQANAVETFFTETLPAECLPTRRDDTAPFVVDSWIPPEIASATCSAEEPPGDEDLSLTALLALSALGRVASVTAKATARRRAQGSPTCQLVASGP